MNFRKITLVAGFILCLAGASLALWNSQPAVIQSASIDLSEDDLILTGQTGQANLNPQTQARLTLEWPAAIPVGEPQTIRLKIVPVPSAHPFSQPSTVHVVAETQLELAGITFQPVGAVQQPWPDGQSLTFTWTIMPDTAVNYEGNVWFTLVFVQQGGIIIDRKPISDQTIKIHSFAFLGAPPKTVRLAGLTGLGLGALVFIFGLIKKKQPLNSI